MIVSAELLPPQTGEGAQGPGFKELSMRKLCGCWFVLVLATGPAGADIAQGNLVRDTWEAAYLEGAKAGYVHTTVREVERNGEKRYRTSAEQHLTLKRGGNLLTLRMETGT